MCSYKFWKIHRAYNLKLSYKFIKKRLKHRYFPVNITKFLTKSPLQNISDCSCVWYLFLPFWLKKLSEWFSSISKKVAANSVSKMFACCNHYQYICYLKVPKFLQCHRQPEALWGYFEISVPLVHDHPAAVDIFQKFYERDPYFQTNSFSCDYGRIYKKFKFTPT